MWGSVFTVVSLCSLLFYMYGVLISITVTEKNACKMTYMFEYPQFVKIDFAANDAYPKYNLYAYSEGRLTENARKMQFNGAPVIFVPGNSGSYKQARSFASVALRKGLDTNFMQHLDYFTLDYNEEYSALFGGFLDDQAQYLSHCIDKVLDLYKHLPNRPASVVLVAHSMGGKIAQAAMMQSNISVLVNTVIMIAAPLDRAVLNVDIALDQFYHKTNGYWSENRIASNVPLENDTNTCCAHRDPVVEQVVAVYDKVEIDNKNNGQLLNDVLIISIGGGSRDLLVHPGLTTSVFSDVHAMSSSIPNIWLTTDHLCSVWCLQQVLVINKFLYNIIATPAKQRNQGLQFVEDKQFRLQKAKQQFTTDISHRKYEEVTLITGEPGDWVEDSRRVFSEQFKTGLDKTRYQMIRLISALQHQMLNLETVNVDGEDWLFGCAATDVTNNMRYCTKATAIHKHVQKIPSHDHERKLVTIDMHKFKQSHPTWTHIIVRLLPTKKPIQINIDVHNPSDRELIVRMPKWYQFSNIKLVSETTTGSSAYTLKIHGMDEAYQTMELTVRPTINCSKYHTTAKVCVPYTRGFERFHHFTESDASPLVVYTPISKPNKYNSSVNPITVELHLDPSCRYTIDVKHSFAHSVARIVQLFTHWLPAHLVVVLLLTLKHQLSLTPKDEAFKSGSLRSGILSSSSFFIITASRLFTKMVLWATILPPPDAFEHSLVISVIIHGSAVAILSIASGGLWLAVSLCGNAAYKILFKLIQLPIPNASGVLLAVIQKCPSTVGVVLISMAFTSCGGLALVVGVLFYFVLLTKMYENYLEDFVFSAAKTIADKLISGGAVIGEESTNSSEAAEKSADENTVRQSDDDEEKDETKHDNVTDAEDDDGDDEQTTTLDDEKTQLIASDDAEKDAELDKLLKESLEQQSKGNAEKLKEEKLKRAEYDAIPDGYNGINFHMTLFMFLVLLAALNLPSVFAWAKNYPYSRTLAVDPSFVPAITSLASLTILWQLNTPRNINGYRIVSSLFYMLAVICILYCQESIYRLNAVVPVMFVAVAMHQLLMPTHKRTVVISPSEMALREKVEQLKKSFLNGDPTE